MLTGIHNAVIIYNPATGRWRHRRLQELEEARRVLRDAGIETSLEATTGRGSGTELAREAVRQGAQLAIACGGDGTINEVVNGLAGSHVPLAVLPAGTANVLAKELGLPWNVPAAARLIPSGSPRRIALGLAVSSGQGGAQRYFMSMGGAGPDGSMIYSVDPRLKQRAGILAYWLEGLRHLFVYPLTPFQVTVAGQRTDATLVVVGRTKHYGGPFRITTGASLFENSFQMALCTTRSRFRYVLYMPAVWFSTLPRMRDVHFLKAASVRCEPSTEQPIYVQVDGEAAGKLPVEFRIVPHALALVVPGSPR